MVASYRNMTEPELIAAWLHGRSPHTQRAYLADWSTFRNRVEKPLQELTLSDLQAFAVTIPHSPARARATAALKSLLAFAHEIGFVSQDAGRLLKLGSVRSRLAERILPETDVLRLITLEPVPRNRTLLGLLYSSGIRTSELCGLCWRDLQGNQISVLGKGGEVRAIQLPDSVCKTLQQLRTPGVTQDTKIFGIQSLAVHRIVRKAAIRAGIQQQVSPHWLRHSHASHALDRGAPIHLVQATLGHASLQTTGRYLHARPKDSSSRFLLTAKLETD
jgi:site-specific recombinase XerD